MSGCRTKYKIINCPAGNYMFKVNNKDTRMTPDVVLVFLLLTLNIFHTLFQRFY